MRNIPISRIVIGGPTALLFALLAARLSACAICIGLPEETAADALVKGHCVVLARQEEGNRFAYAPREVLKGTFDGEEIDLLVDSATRRVLRSDSNRYVLLVQQDPSGDWRSLGVASDDYLRVIRRIVLFAEAWRAEDGGEQRLRFFLSLFGHKDRQTAQLAYLEMGRAPYAMIQRLGRNVPRESYTRILNDPMYFEWRSLAILLLAQSDDPIDKQVVLNSFQDASRFGMTKNLAAWATAAMEVASESTIRSIEDEYFQRSERSDEEIEAVAKAMSLHGAVAGLAIQDRIVDSYGLMLQHHPRLAPTVARDLHIWNRCDLVDELSRILQADSSREMEDVQTIRRYLRDAETSKELALNDD